MIQTPEAVLLARRVDNSAMISNSLPAIGRRLKELPPEARVMAFIAVADAAERQQVDTAAALDLHWLLRDEAGVQTLRQAVAAANCRPAPAMQSSLVKRQWR